MPTLRRSLGLWEVVLTGIIMVQPTAPMPLFGIVHEKAQGHVVTTVLVAMVAMLFTAISYGRMARAYPSAGSAYTYVGQEVHPAMGFLTGWSMLLDYAINPLICTVWCAQAAANILPSVPPVAWKTFFALLFTLLNLRKIQATARTNQVLTAAMGVVIAWMLAACVRYVAGHGPVDLLRPFYDPTAFSFGGVSAGTSLAVLTYIGFDGISTLSEEIHDPRRNIMRATVLVCLIVGVLSAVEVYAAQLVWPFGEKFPNTDTAYVYVAGRAGGPVLFQVLNFTLLIATVGSGAGAQLAGARLLFGMGRDGALPRGFFGAIDPKTMIPRNAVLAVGVVAFAGSLFVSYELGAELLNFGAFIGFMGVNLAAFLRYWWRAERRGMADFLPPLAGLAICFYLWINLQPLSKVVGGAWMAVGLGYGAYMTGGFRRNLPRFEAGE